MLLAIDIGNSSVCLSFFDGTPDSRYKIRLGSDQKRTADEYAAMLHSAAAIQCIPLDAVDEVMISSVVPGLIYTVSSAVHLLFPNVQKMQSVGPGMRTGFVIRTDNPAEVGTDIVANAACAIQEHESPIMIADFGTMTVLSLINTKKELIGNVILPGVKTMFQTVSDYAAQLPDISIGLPTGSDLPLLGKNTAASIRSGILHSHAFAVDAYIDAFEKELNHPLTLLATGGFASVIAPICAHPFTIDADLTAKGLFYLSQTPQKKHS